MQHIHILAVMIDVLLVLGRCRCWWLMMIQTAVQLVLVLVLVLVTGDSADDWEVGTNTESVVVGS